MTLPLELLALLGLILLNAFFVAAEYGLVTSRRTRIRELEREGNRRARDVLKITASPPRFIAAMQLGVTLTSLAIGAFGEQVFANLFEPPIPAFLAVILALLIITFLHVVLGELVPKGIALGHPERVALAVSTPVRGFFVVMRPFIWVLRRATSLVLRLLGQDEQVGEGAAHSEAELRMLLSTSAEQGEIERGEQEIVDKVFDFADKDVADVMVPRPDVLALAADMPAEEVLRVVLESPFTRYPVFRDSIDEIVGVLHVRDLISAMHDRGIAAVKLEELLRPAPMVPETKGLLALLGEFKRTKQHMAIVIDEYGTMEGIVTLEDLLEEIVGEITDEFDEPEEESIERIDDDTVRIEGTMSIDDFNDRFEADLPDADYHTVAGFVFGKLDRTAEPGDEVTHDGIVFLVDEVEGQRIVRLTVTFGWRHTGGAAEDEDELESAETRLRERVLVPLGQSVRPAEPVVGDEQLLAVADVEPLALEPVAVDRPARVQPRDEPSRRVGVVAAGEVLVDQRHVRAVVEVGRDRHERALRLVRLLDERAHAVVGVEPHDRVLPGEHDVAAVADRDRARRRPVLVRSAPATRRRSRRARTRTGCRRPRRAGRRRRDRRARSRRRCRRSRRAGRRSSSSRRRARPAARRPSRRAAHASIAAAKRAFDTTCSSSTASTSSILSASQSSIGLPPTGSSALARFSVSGKSRVA